MPKKLDVSNCKHPNSRKTKAFAKEHKKLENKQKNKFGQALKQNIIGEKILWFKEHLTPDVDCYTPQQTQYLIEQYLSRFEDELEQIKLKHSVGKRKNRQHASREDIINLTIKREKEEYNTCGLEIPNILDAKQLHVLRNWNGELRFLQNFALKRIGKKHLEQFLIKKNQENDSMQIHCK